MLCDNSVMLSEDLKIRVRSTSLTSIVGAAELLVGRQCMARPGNSTTLTAIVLASALGISLAAAPAATAQTGWVVTELTNNSLNDQLPQVSGSNVVWQTWDGNDWEVFFHDGTTSTRLTNTNHWDRFPQVSDTYVVWQAERGDLPSNEIFLYDIASATTTQLTNNNMDDISPQVSGSYVVWMSLDENYFWEIYLYDGNVITQITDNSRPDVNPQICGSHVVWEHYSSGYEIFLYDIDTGVTRQLTSNGGPQYYHPRVSDSHVVWMTPDIGDVTEVFLYEIETGVTVQLTDNSYEDKFPDVSGSHVAWLGGSTASNQVFLYDINTGTTTQLTNNSYQNSHVRLSGSHVVWHENYGGSRILAYDINTGTTTQLAVYGGGSQGVQNPEVSGSTVVWQGASGGDWEILLARPDNQPPVADPGDGQTVHVGSEVTLDGSGSSDPDEDYPLTYAWHITAAPLGSGATLSDPTAVNPSFTADEIGDYEIELIVTDARGAVSDPAYVTISTWNSAPVADAGEDQAIIELDTSVQLGADVGRESYDPDGDPITYFWAVVERPAGSAAELSDVTSATPTFVADVQGDYVVNLVVSDPWASSDVDSVTISFDNVPPVADAGGGQCVLVYESVQLDGSASSDANLDLLTYSWSFVSKPEGSLAELDNPAVERPSFIADQIGTYVLSLVVNDGFVDSEASNVTITAISTPCQVIDKLGEAIDAINALTAESLKNKQMKTPLTNKLNAVAAKIDAGSLAEALDKLHHDLAPKMDGCAAGGSGTPDPNDWLISCDAQNLIYPLLEEAIYLLEHAAQPCP